MVAVPDSNLSIGGPGVVRADIGADLKVPHVIVCTAKECEYNVDVSSTLVQYANLVTDKYWNDEYINTSMITREGYAQRLLAGDDGVNDGHGSVEYLIDRDENGIVHGGCRLVTTEGSKSDFISYVKAALWAIASGVEIPGNVNEELLNILRIAGISHFTEITRLASDESDEVHYVDFQSKMKERILEAVGENKVVCCIVPNKGLFGRIMFLARGIEALVGRFFKFKMIGFSVKGISTYLEYMNEQRELLKTLPSDSPVAIELNGRLMALEPLFLHFPYFKKADELDRKGRGPGKGVYFVAFGKKELFNGIDKT